MCSICAPHPGGGPIPRACQKRASTRVKENMLAAITCLNHLLRRTNIRIHHPQSTQFSAGALANKSDLRETIYWSFILPGCICQIVLNHFTSTATVVALGQKGK